MNWIFIVIEIALYIANIVYIMQKQNFKKSLIIIGSLLVFADIIYALTLGKYSVPSQSLINEIAFLIGQHFLGICGLILVRCAYSTKEEVNNADLPRKFVNKATPEYDEYLKAHSINKEKGVTLKDVKKK